MAGLDESVQNEILLCMAEVLRQNTDQIIKANKQDIENAQGRIAPVMIDRLRLDESRIEGMAQGIIEVAQLESPIGLVEKQLERPNGLQIQKVRVPVGVVAIIYESRPNVTTDAAALCIKSGNACILRGGSDALQTNIVLVDLMRKAFLQAGGPLNGVQLVADTDHGTARQLMEARGYVDLLIPRGGANLIRAVVDGARGVPVIETGTGICHVYVDKDADLTMAADVLYNAKTSRPSVCNSAEVCLVDKTVAAEFLPLAASLLAEKNVELRLDPEAAAIVKGVPAGADDFDTEFLDYILAVKVVDGVEQAIEHINQHSTGHSDSIITASNQAAQKFMKQVDSAAVYHNASTRFTDGGVFGLGCEMGISTQKIGARGPMGLYELTSYKYLIEGNGQVR